jgi:hypothetical protein
MASVATFSANTGDKSLSVTCDRSVVFSGYSGFLHYLTEILLNVVLNTINNVLLEVRFIMYSLALLNII